MTPLEIIITAASGPLGAGAILGIGKAIDAWRRRRDLIDEEEVKARKEVALAWIAADDRDGDREERLIERLAERVRELEKVRDDMHATLVATKEALLETKQALLEAHAIIERQSVHLADREQRLAALEKRIPADMTGKIRTEAATIARREVRRALSDPAGIPAVREEVTRKPGDDR